jgi:hypothetical protein
LTPRITQPITIAKINGKNLKHIMIQFEILATVAEIPEVKINHTITTKEINTIQYHCAFHPKAF